MRNIFLGFTLLLCFIQLSAQPRVPSTFTYCGIEVTLSRGAQERIQSHVDKIFENPTYLKRMVAKAKMYFPFIEEAFRDERVPTDIKYLSIQESALKPNAVSMSNAVGFWQFKEGSAKETGLLVDRYVDERKHIYRASIGSAKYFARANSDFNNWVYAIVSYYEGPTGAVPFTDPSYYGRKKMKINDDFHWYALKAMAHKIAYQAALELDVSVNYYLMPFATNGQRTWKEVLDDHNLSEESFFTYNQWISDKKRIPFEQDFTYYIPIPASQYKGHYEDPSKQLKIALNSPDANLAPSNDINVLTTPFETKTEPSPKPQQAATSEPVTPMATSEIYPGGSFMAQPVSVLSRDRYAVFNLKDDLHYQKVYTLYEGEQSFERFSSQLLLFSDQLLRWNHLQNEAQLEPPHLLYLSPWEAVHFHVVEKGETLPSIARMHKISVGKILRKNRMAKSDTKIYIGQKLYLKKKKPKGEKIIILETKKEVEMVETPSYIPPSSSTVIPNSISVPDTTTLISTPTVETHANDNIGSSSEIVNSMPKPSRPPVQELTSHWIEHTVSQGETLWSISKRYGTKVEIIKRINQMDTTDLFIGQVLKIMSNEEIGRGKIDR